MSPGRRSPTTDPLRGGCCRGCRLTRTGRRTHACPPHARAAPRGRHVPRMRRATRAPTRTHPPMSTRPLTPPAANPRAHATTAAPPDTHAPRQAHTQYPASLPGTPTPSRSRLAASRCSSMGSPTCAISVGGCVCERVRVCARVPTRTKERVEPTRTFATPNPQLPRA